MNFKIGSPVVEGFIDRKVQRKELRNGIKNNHYALIGLRRTGKTSLALKMCEEMSKQMIPVYIDVSFIAPLTEKNFLKTFADNVVEAYSEYTGDKNSSLKFKRFLEGAKDAVVELIKSSRVAMGEVAEVYFKSEDNLTEMIKVTMELSDKLAVDASRDFLIVLDEFPRLLELNNKDFIWALRSHIHRSSNTHYIISGSAVSSMKYLLEEKSPFFGTLLSIRLEGLEEDALDEFIRSCDVKFTAKARKQLTDVTGMLPLYLQAFFHVVDTRGIKKVDNLMLEEITAEVFDMLDTHFEYYFEEIKGFKRSILIMMAARGIHTASEMSDVLEKSGNYIGTYLRRLGNEGFLKPLGGGEYEVADPFFKLWIQEHAL